MKDIGNIFKEKREEIGVKLEEAASDLDITVAQLENLEDGNINAFKDIFFLKELIKKYATYLNVDGEKMIEEFNDFVFDFTYQPINLFERGNFMSKASNQKPKYPVIREYKIGDMTYIVKAIVKESVKEDALTKIKRLIMNDINSTGTL